MKFALFCTIAALIGVLLAKCAFGQALSPKTLQPNYDSVQLTHPVEGHWATLFWRNDNERQNPTGTYIVTSWQPVVHQSAPHRWTIYFVKTQ